MEAQFWERLFPELKVTGLEKKENHVIVQASIRASSAVCPSCGVVSQAVHSYRKRQVTDRPILGESVVINVQIRRFRCHNQDCHCRTFTETVPGYIERRIHRSVPLQNVLTAVGMELGGQAGSRLAGRLAMPVSGSSLLRLVRRYRHPPVKDATAVGIDDWSIRRGRTFGSILVDLDHHRPIGLLPSRQIPDVINWLRQFEPAQVITRDRAADYRHAIREVWPTITQVIDRWHLKRNLADVMEQICASEHTTIEQAAAEAGGEGKPPEISKYFQLRQRSATEEAQHQRTLKHRQTRYLKIHQLRQAGSSIRQIAEQLHLSQGTVCRDLRSSVPQGPNRHKHRPSLLDPFVDYLMRRWQEGCTNVSQLFREIHAQGFTGTREVVRKWATPRRTTPATTSWTKNTTHSPTKIDLPSVRTLAWLVGHPETNWTHTSLSTKTLVQQLLSQPIFKEAHRLSLAFDAAFREKSVRRFDAWHQQCLHSSIAAMRSFASGMDPDLQAIRNAVQLPWSSGQCEGQITRLKLLKRQMYGRANIDLLETRLRWPIRDGPLHHW